MTIDLGYLATLLIGVVLGSVVTLLLVEFTDAGPEQYLGQSEYEND